MAVIFADIVMKLWDAFPDSFSVKKESPTVEYYPGRFDTEESVTGTETVVLADCIACTAQAISHCGTDMDRAIRYIESFRPAHVQKQQIRTFLEI